MSPFATGLMAMLNCADVPVHPVLSVAVTVKRNVPVCDGVPLIPPLEASVRLVGSPPVATTNE